MLTAAHCLPEEAIDFTVAINLTAFDNLDYVTLTSDAAVLVHPDYNSTMLESDVGLIFLDESIGNVVPIALNNRSKVPVDGMDLQVLGFGHTEEYNDTIHSDSSVLFPGTLQVATVAKVPTDVCVAQYDDETSLSISSRYHMCAASPGKVSWFLFIFENLFAFVFPAAYALYKSAECPRQNSLRFMRSIFQPLMLPLQ